jgi:hypothetical protein
MTKAPYITPQMLHTYARQRSGGDPIRYKQEIGNLEREIERIRRENDRRASRELAERIFHAVVRH